MAYPIPMTNAGRLRKYGNSEAHVRQHLVNITLFGVRNVWVHELAVSRFKAWEKRVRDYEKANPKVRAFTPRRIDSFNWRYKSGTRTLSMHSFGLAVDIDPNLNPFGYKHSHHIPKYVSNRARLSGITWGGGWRKHDYMHFEYRY